MVTIEVAQVSLVFPSTAGYHERDGVHLAFVRIGDMTTELVSNAQTLAPHAQSSNEAKLLHAPRQA